MNYEAIKYEVKDRILTITLNRPEILNAFNGAMMRELIDAFDRADKDDEIRVIIVTGEGRGFCAGADLSAGPNTFDYQKRTDRPDRMFKEGEEVNLSDERIRDGGGRVTLRIFESLKPVIGAINGPSTGIGMTMQLPMDIRIASTKARFGFVFSRRGIVMEACSSWFLPRLVGMQQALQWVFSGRVFDAAEALKGGLVAEVVEPEELLPRARAIAKEIIDNTAPVSIALMRHMLWKMAGADHPMEAHKVDSRGVFVRGQSADVKEGVASFLEKRPPDFKMKVSTDMPSYFPWWEERKYS